MQDFLIAVGATVLCILCCVIIDYKDRKARQEGVSLLSAVLIVGALMALIVSFLLAIGGWAMTLGHIVDFFLERI